MTWGLWIRQALTITRVELKRYILAKRWLGIYLIAAGPVFLLMLQAFRRHRNLPPIEDFSRGYAAFFQVFMLRLAIFFSCVAVFSQMFRGEILEKTLHYYLLAPVRREVIAAGKYLAGVIAMGIVFGACTIATNILIYMPNPGYAAFFFEGDGIPQLARYLLVVVLATAAYGSIFLLLGLIFKNPILPAVAVLGWEAFYFVLPASVQKVTVVHYLQSILPVSIDLGPFAVVVDPTPPFLGMLVLLIAAAALVWLAGRILRRSEVTYSAD